MFKKWYITHEDVQTPSNGTAIFGPFRAREVNERLNDAYGDLLSCVGNVDATKLSKRYIKKSYANPRGYWMDQLRDLEREV